MDRIQDRCHEGAEMTAATADLNFNLSAPDAAQAPEGLPSQSAPLVTSDEITTSNDGSENPSSGDLVPNHRVEDADAGRLVECACKDLRPHPDFERHRLSIDMRELSRIATLGESIYQKLIIINQEFEILDGYELVHYAGLQKRLTLSCLQFNMSKQESLLCLLRNHQRSAGLNDFCLILLALGLEPGLKAEAQENQSRGGRLKGLSVLAQASPVDVRAAIAKLAGVSAGNVSKVKGLLTSGDPKILEALRCGDLTINRASAWSTCSHYEQRAAYSKYQSDKGMNTLIRTLISNLPQRDEVTSIALRHLHSGFSMLKNDKRLSQYAEVIELLLHEIAGMEPKNSRAALCG